MVYLERRNRQETFENIGEPINGGQLVGIFPRAAGWEHRVLVVKRRN